MNHDTFTHDRIGMAVVGLVPLTVDGQACSGQSGASCAEKGCDPVCGFFAGDPCQCDAECHLVGECCGDYGTVCAPTTASPTSQPTYVFFSDT